MTKEFLRPAIEAYCADLAAASRRGSTGAEFYCDWQGRKFLRIVRKTVAGESAFMFVRRSDGTLWKPHGWKGPALNFSRGSVFDERDPSRMYVI